MSRRPRRQSPGTRGPDLDMETTCQEIVTTIHNQRTGRERLLGHTHDHKGCSKWKVLAAAHESTASVAERIDEWVRWSA